MMYYLRVLGGVSLEDSSEVVSSSAAQQRPLAVLAILAVAREQGCSRDKLVGYLWPESDQERARHRLADIVHLVRKSLGDATILSSGATLRLNRQLVESDVAAFLDALDAGNLESAVEHYGGPLLDGFYLSGLPEFERWMESERQRLGDEFSDALQALAAASGTSGDHIAAAKWWKRLLAHDPYNSRFATGLMEALARSGDPANALQYAQEHERLLRDELGMEPDPRLAALAERLKREPVTVTEGDRATTTEGDRAITADSMPVPLEGARTEPVRGRRFLTFRNAGLRLLAVLAVFGIVAVGWMMLGDGAPLDAPKSAAVLPLDNDTEALAEAGPGIAVLPFRVHGDGLELWREGMVDLLSTDMNGVGGLRAIDSRTLLAHWREKLPETGDPDRETALQVAQASGARYALLGSAIGIGSAVRLSADIYDTEGGAQLGSVQVEGAPDSVLALVDRLAVQALLVALEREASELPPVDLASVTTASIPALTAWLEAEALHRHGDIPAAMAAYERAVAADSTFALAFHGLSLAYGWFEGGDRIASASELALRWVDRLPAREAALVRGTNAWLQGELSEADEILQRLVRTHPDYAMAWYALGELYYHTGTVIPVSVDDAGRCFTRAVELDSQFAPFRLHIIDMAFELEPDSAIAARLITDYKRLASANAVHTRLVEVAFDLVFADQAHRQRALASLDTLDPIILQGLPGNPPLTHPRFWPYFEAVLLARQERGIRPGNTTTFLFRGAAMGRGYLKKAMEYLDRPQSTPYNRGCLPVDAYVHGLPVAPARLEAAAAVLSQIDSTSRPALMYCAAFLAAAQGRWADHARAVELAWDHWRREVDAGRSGRNARADALAVEAYGLWLRGEPEAAVGKLEEVRRYRVTRRVRTVLGYVLMDLERWEEALPYLSTWWGYIHSHMMQYHLARAYEAMGEDREAVKEYASFVEAWADADPELQPWVEDARQALARLSPDR